MNITILDSWLREFVETDATPEEIKNYLSLCGPSVERINKIGSDYAFEIEVTSNRVDMMSVTGIAREMVAILPRFNKKAKFTAKYADLVETSKKDLQEIKKLSFEISDPDNLCPRLLAIVLDNITVKPSPKLIINRLESSGIRALGNLIDITNYVMTEVGHPCHIFDYDRIRTAKLLIRHAKNGEKLITLDNKEYKLTDQDVVIDDGTGRVIDLPGIMGTENSVVTDFTKRVVLFIESNDPLVIRKTSMRLGIRTIAATMNEKSPDPNLALIGIVRGVKLLEEMAEAKVGSPLIDIYKKPKMAKSIIVSNDFITKRMGIDLTATAIANILTSMEFKVKEKKSSKDVIFTITVPSWRQNDIQIPEDVVEEVARIYGYQRLPNNIMTGEIPLTTRPLDLVWEEKVKNILKGFGLTEILTYSFISDELLQKSGLGEVLTLKLANPLSSDWTTMRPSLVPGMYQALSQNKDRAPKLKLFELSKTYTPREDALPLEEDRLCLGVVNVTFRELKGIIEALFNSTGIKNFEIKPAEADTETLSRATSGNIFAGGKFVGTIGRIPVNIALNFGLENAYIADLTFRDLIEFFNPAKNYIATPLYPPFIEDLALITKPKTQIGDLMSQIKKCSDLVYKVELLDEYENTKTLRIYYQSSDKELTPEEVRTVRLKILKLVEEKFDAYLKLNT